MECIALLKKKIKKTKRIHGGKYLTIYEVIGVLQLWFDSVELTFGIYNIPLDILFSFIRKFHDLMTRIDDSFTQSEELRVVRFSTNTLRW